MRGRGLSGIGKYIPEQIATCAEPISSRKLPMIRSASSSDLDLLLTACSVDPVGMFDADRYRRELELNQCRLKWSWFHEDKGRLLGRALWWGLPHSPHPTGLDCVWVDPSVTDPAGIAAAVVNAGHASFRDAGINQLPALTMQVPPDWRADPFAVTAVAWRQQASASAGLTHVIERLRYAWTQDKALPQRSPRLTFTPADDDAFIDVFIDVARGSLDIHTQADLAELGPDGQAADDLAFYKDLPGDRGLWRLAHDAEGVRVGFIIPSRSAYDASVSYLGVVPWCRGQGFVDDLLAEITIMHVENGAPRITGTTDTTNAPMAAAFLRAGYDVTSARIVIRPDPAAASGGQ